MWSVERDVSRKFWGPSCCKLGLFYPLSSLWDLPVSTSHEPWVSLIKPNIKVCCSIQPWTKNTTPIGFQLSQVLHTLYGWKNMKCKEMFWNHKATYTPPDKTWTHVIHIYIYKYTLIFKRALISGCFLVRICFGQIERIFPSRAEICQTSTSWVFTACLWFKKTGRTTSAISRNRAQFPANEHTFEKWLFSNLAVPRAEIGKTSRFGFLEQKFARAEISVLLKLQVYIYGPVLVASDITSMGWSSPVLSPILPPPSDSPCWRLPPRHCPHSQSLGLSKSVAVTTGWTQM